MKIGVAIQLGSGTLHKKEGAARHAPRPVLLGQSTMRDHNDERSARLLDTKVYRLADKSERHHTRCYSQGAGSGSQHLPRGAKPDRICGSKSFQLMKG